MEFKLFDKDGTTSVIRDESDIVRIASAGFAGLAEIVDDENYSLACFEDVTVPSGDIVEMRDILFDLIADVPVGHRNGELASMVYTTGNCDLLAKALAEVFPEGRVVGVLDPLNEDGDPVEGPHFLIHAGLLVGDRVIDVTGVCERQDWVDRCSYPGSTEIYVAELDQAYFDRMRPSGIPEADMNNARRIAELFRVVSGIPTVSVQPAIP